MQMKMKPKKALKCHDLIKAINAYIAKSDTDFESVLSDAGFAEPKKTMQRINQIEDELTDLLEDDTNMILTRIDDYENLKDFINEQWPELQNSQDLVEKLTRVFESHLEESIPEYVTEYILRTDAGLEAVGLTHSTTNWIQSWSEELARLMKLNDNQTIQQILDDAVRDGTSVQKVSELIAESGIRNPAYRARKTAVTEILRAHSVAQQESFMQSPAVEGKMWRHSGWRQYSRQNHMDMDGQQVSKNEPYTLYGADGGVYYPMYPRDAGLPAKEVINCGCISEPIVSEYILGLSLEERQKLQQEAIDQMNDEYDRMLDEQNRKLTLRT